jgi:hypothetical protein
MRIIQASSPGDFAATAAAEESITAASSPICAVRPKGIGRLVDRD